MDRVNLKTFKDFGVDYIEYDFDPDAGSDENNILLNILEYL